VFPPDSIRVAREASVGRLGANVYVLGDDVRQFDLAISAHNLLSAWLIGAGGFGTPVGRHTFAYPRTATDGAGRLHVLWADLAPDRDSVEAYSWPATRFESVWAATYDAGGGWSEPTLLLRTQLDWNTRRSGDIARADSDRLLFVTPQLGLGLAVFRFDRGSWHATELPTAAHAAYTSVAVGRATAILAFIAADVTARAPDRNSVFVQWSLDHGASWKPAVLVSASRESPAYDVKVLRDMRGAVHLVWRQTVSTTSSVIRHISSTDLGMSWSPPDDLPLRGPTNGLVAVFDRCNRLQVVLEDWSGGDERVALIDAVWDGAWSPLQRLYPSMRALGASIRSLSDSTTVLTFLGSPSSAPSADQYLSYYAFLTPPRTRDH
jgi:hypothetical protein